MLGNHRLVLDTTAEQYQLLRPYADAEFWDFAAHDPMPNSVYLLGRQQTVDNMAKFRNMAMDHQYVMIFGNSAEGSRTLLSQIEALGIKDLITSGQVLLISGGDLEPSVPCLVHEHFFARILDYQENIQAQAHTSDIFNKKQKPYSFLFLNGRARAHRKYLWEKFRQSTLLDHSLWTMLDGRKAGSRMLQLRDQNGHDVMDTNTPIQHLPAQYEVDRYQNSDRIDVSNPHQYIKNQVFDNEWGEIYLNPKAYIDTYFSVVTETVFDYPYSFRTEKIAKVLAMGHPWICASNQGFYRDLRNMGFRTFAHIIDESFDLIDNHQMRLDRIHDVVADLCAQDLAGFLDACSDICKYNQQHLAQLVPKIKAEFPQQFLKFINRE